MNVLSLLAIPLGYILGSFPSSYLVGRIYHINLLKEGDGHISATAVYRTMGTIPFLIVLLLDVSKGMLAIYFAQLLTEYQLLILLAGLAAVIGHCWSIFIKFQGGLGATITHSILFLLLPVHFLIGGIIAIITLFVTKKSSIGTISLIMTISILLLIQYIFSPYSNGLLLVDYPIVLMLVQYLKRLQIKKSGKGSEYQNELFDDLKRVRQNKQ